jgi:hypothetical protein
MRSLFVAVPFLFMGCVSQTSGPARAQETSNEFNLNTRFGRMEIAIEKVAPSAREDFTKHHQGWGSRIRIADLEGAGMRMTNEAKTEADVTLRFAWYRQDEDDLRSTTIRQHWREFKGDWKLVAEERVDGDVGLLGEPVERVRAPAQDAPRKQFPTVHLTGGAAQND